MATVTVTTESYVDVPDDTADPDATAEAIVKDALAVDSAIYLVKITRTGVLLEH